MNRSQSSSETDNMARSFRQRLVTQVTGTSSMTLLLVWSIAQRRPLSAKVQMASRGEEAGQPPS